MWLTRSTYLIYMTLDNLTRFEVWLDLRLQFGGFDVVKHAYFVV